MNIHLRASKTALPPVSVRVRLIEGMGVAQGHSNSVAKQSSDTGCTVRKSSEVFSASRRGRGKEAAGPKGSEQRLLWGSIEHS